MRLSDRMDFLKVPDILVEDHGSAACEHFMYATFIPETGCYSESEVLAICIIV
jgi:hypothetical protein